MTQVATPSSEDIARFVSFFAAVRWPLSAEGAAGIGEGLGWTVSMSRARGMNFTTPAPIDPPSARMMFTEGRIGEIVLDASDRFKEPADDTAGVVRDATRHVVDVVTSLLGPPTVSTAGKTPTRAWDLDNGGRLSVSDLGRVAQVSVLQAAYAAIELGEEAAGVEDRLDVDPA